MRAQFRHWLLRTGAWLAVVVLASGSADENPGGVWRGNGDRYRAEADEPYEAVRQLAEMLRIDFAEA